MRTAWLGVLSICFGLTTRAETPPGPSAVLLNAPTAVPNVAAGPTTFPIDLPTALRLANVRPLDVAIAARHVELAERNLARTKLLWVPNLVVGADYFRHEGGQQNFIGDIVRSSRGSVAVGFGPNLVVSTSEAIFAPLAARQELLARTRMAEAVSNDQLLSVAEAYFGIQQARAELAGATRTATTLQTVSTKITALAEGLVAPIEGQRARIELARRKQAVVTANERWRVASADLVRLLRLDATVLVEPVEPADLTITLIAEQETVDSLIPIALTTRPELAAHQAVVRATLARLKQEKLRPLTPSLAVRSTATNPSGSLGFAGFGGGANGRIGNFDTRFDIDVQLLWEFSALGLGNRVRVGERRAEHQLATLELFRTQDRIAAEVATTFAQLSAAKQRLALTAPALQEATELLTATLAALGQTRRIGETITLVVRPQEAVSAVVLFAQANADHAAAVADVNRGQFRLYRALGHPATAVSAVYSNKPTGDD